MPELFHVPSDRAQFSPDKMKKVNLYESPQLFCDVYCLEPGQEQKAHEHKENDKIYHALSGTCTVQVGDEFRPLSAGQLAVAPAGVIHGVKNESNERATLLVIMAPHPRLKSSGE